MSPNRYHAVFSNQFEQTAGSLRDIGELYIQRRQQRGDGLGDVLKNLFNYLSPYLISSGKSIAGELVRGAGDLLYNKDDKKPLKERLKNQLKISATNLEDKATKKLNAMREQRGFGVKKSAKRSAVITSAIKEAKKLPKVLVKSVKKRKVARSKQDIFDEYKTAR